ncbi:hypothetical protein DPMN_055942 [Dreissena polymorpha]|uniref:Serpin domain-containing protein n=1 Tax=Dreissena polymorpha TaxID=45954 RepID=A0A9D4CQU7_DREPO|nr:hypothetical protein DPMN_055942 [Dreissena polymorpha]
MAMLVLLPDTVTGLLKMEKHLYAQRLNQCIKDVSSATVIVFVPKVKLESSFQLSDTLSALGISDVFCSNKADLSRMGKDLFVSEVFHKSSVDVNEEGTEAAAATAVRNSLKIYKQTRPQTLTFTADHPFMIMI